MKNFSLTHMCAPVFVPHAKYGQDGNGRIEIPPSPRHLGERGGSLAVVGGFLSHFLGLTWEGKNCPQERPAGMTDEGTQAGKKGKTPTVSVRKGLGSQLCG